MRTVALPAMPSVDSICGNCGRDRRDPHHAESARQQTLDCPLCVVYFLDHKTEPDLAFVCFDDIDWID